MYVSYTRKQVDPDFSRVRRLLFYSIDGIGDAVLESAVFARLPQVFPNAAVTVFCQKVSAGFFGRCPFVERVISIDSKEASKPGYLDAIFQQLAEVQADLALNLVSRPSSGLIMFLWAAQAPIMSIAPQWPPFAGEPGRVLLNAPAKMSAASSGRGHGKEPAAKYDGRPAEAPVKGVENAPVNTPGHVSADEERCRADFIRSIGAVIPTRKGSGHVLAEQMDALRALGLEPAQTRVWLTEQDRAEAAQIFAEAGLEPASTIALAGVSSSPLKDYPHFAEALAPVCRKLGLNVLALGGKAEHAANAGILFKLKEAGIKTFNASGKTELSVSAALLEKSLFAMGVDTGLMHMACALERPNAVLLGCGNIGRVWPYSAFNSIICLPLSCMRCDWRCPYPECYCVKGLLPEFAGEAVERAIKLHYPQRFATTSPVDAQPNGATTASYANLKDTVPPSGVNPRGAALPAKPAGALVFMQQRGLFIPPENGIKWQSPAGIIDQKAAPEYLQFGIMRKARLVEEIEA